MSKPLERIRVIDLSHVLAGPFATMILADLGAEVIKVEQPGSGDASRQYGPFIDGVSSYFTSVNRRKKSVTLNLKNPKGRELLLKLIETADILIENFSPGVMERLDLSYETLSTINPKLIYVNISGFGNTGPIAHKRSYDMLIQGISGIISITGESGDRPPIRTGISVSDLSTGLYSVIGILAALQQRQKTDRGDYLDISMLDCSVALLENAIARYTTTGEVPQPCGNRHPVITPFQIFPTQDGYITLAAGSESTWERLCIAIGREDLIKDDRFSTNRLRTENQSTLEDILSHIFRQLPSQVWIDEFDRRDIPCGPIATIEDVVQNPQLIARDMFIHVKNQTGKAVTVPNCPIRLSSMENTDFDVYSPSLGDHTKEVLADLLDLSDKTIDELYRSDVL